MTKDDGSREEVDLSAPGRREEGNEDRVGPGQSPLDDALRDLREGLGAPDASPDTEGDG